VAFGVIRGIKEGGREIPDDVSVIGFDDISLAHMFLPPLTTIRQHISRNGETASRILIEQIRGKSRRGNKGSHTLIPMELVERQTVRRLNG
jgi:LacI family transcriptional regulator